MWSMALKPTGRSLRVYDVKYAVFNQLFPSWYLILFFCHYPQAYDEMGKVLNSCKPSFLQFLKRKFFIETMIYYTLIDYNSSTIRVERQMNNFNNWILSRSVQFLISILYYHPFCCSGLLLCLLINKSSAVNKTEISK